MNGHEAAVIEALEKIKSGEVARVILPLPEGSRLVISKQKGGIRLTKKGKRVYNLLRQGAEGGE